MRQILPRFLSEHERIQISDMASMGMGPTAIGRGSRGIGERGDQMHSPVQVDSWVAVIERLIQAADAANSMILDKIVFIRSRHSEILHYVQPAGVTTDHAAVPHAQREQSL